MVMSCNSKVVCVDVENPVVVKRRSVKPEWHKAHARFIINLCMEKEREREAANDGNNNTSFVSSFSSSSSSSSYSSLIVEEGGYGSWLVGSRNVTGSPDTYVWRQRYLRSYTFTRNERKNKGLHEIVLEKVKKWIDQMSKGGRSKEGLEKMEEKKKKKKSCCTVDGCLKFLLCFVAKVDVQIG